MMPFSLALERTGGVDLAADALVALTGGAGGHVVLASLFVVTATIGPVRVQHRDRRADGPGRDGGGAGARAPPPIPFAMIVALGASSAYMTPISSPVNTLVVEPGGYSFGDFVRVGVPLTVIVLVVSVVLVPWLFPF